VNFNGKSKQRKTFVANATRDKTLNSFLLATMVPTRASAEYMWEDDFKFRMQEFYLVYKNFAEHQKPMLAH
jgi:hypothetical protein